MAVSFDQGIYSAEDVAGAILVGAKLYFYTTGTSNLLATYSDAALTTANANPVVAGADGRFGPIWLQNADYKVVLKTSADVTLVTRDPVKGGLQITTTVTTVAAMTALAKVGLTNNQIIVVGGRTSNNDGGGGVFYWDASSTTTADSGTVFAADAGGDGRWKRILENLVTPIMFGGVDGGDLAASTDLALTYLGTTNNATLTFPKGASAYSLGSSKDWNAYRNVTFRFEPGCLINQGANTVVLPERVEMGLGARFTGAGAVTVKNKDQLLLTTPPAQYVVAGNYANGVGALSAVTTGFNNFAWGYKALNSLTAGRSNIAIGVDTLKTVTGGTATSASGTYMSNGDGNVAIGDMCLRALTTGYENVGVGMYNMYALTTGRWNVCLGVQNLELNTTGECNVAIGPYALVTATGNNNVAIGFSVMENQTTGSNVGIGYVALGGSTTANLNTAIGSQAMQLCETGTENVTVGQEALKNATAPANCVAIGAYALGTATGASTNNTAVGRNALLALTTGSSNTAVGSGANNVLTTETNATAIGFNTQCIASNQVTLGDANVTSLRCAVTTITAISDERFKKDIAPLDIPDEFLDEVEIVTFKWAVEGMTDAPQVGVIAQQLDALQTKHGLEWLGLVDKTNPDRWEATPGKLLFPLIMRTQRLARRVAALEAVQ